MKNYSKQKQEILMVMKNLQNHPTAEEIYFLVKTRDSSVSRSTIYRNLSRMVNNGIVTQIPISNGPDRFKYKVDGENYFYIVCTKCGNISNYSYEMDDFLDKQKEIFEKTGVEIYSDGVTIKGICKTCKEALDNKLGGNKNG